MSIKRKMSLDGKIMHLDVAGRFDYRLLKDFQLAYKDIEQVEGITYLVNLKDADFIDSAAMGHLLVLREYATKKNGEVIIDNPSLVVSNALMTAKFDSLFTINHAGQIDQISKPEGLLHIKSRIYDS